MGKHSKKQLIGFYTTMLRIRRVEEKLMEVFGAGEIPGFIHVCIGQEAAPVAVCSHLKDTDQIATTHRGHGHALAKGIDLKLFMAELFGRANGPCRGRSGSMHLAEAGKGILGANGIVGGGIPIATGAALASQLKKTGAVTVCCFGEGATDEGTFHESLNLASLRRLPIVFLCENNGWAEFTPQAVHMPIKDVAGRAKGYDVPGVSVGNDFFKIHEEAGKAVMRARRGEGPTLLEVKSSRWYGHFVGDAQKYRSEDDILKARGQDCILLMEGHLLKEEVVQAGDMKRIEGEIDKEIEEAVAFARRSPMPEAWELMDGLYV